MPEKIKILVVEDNFGSAANFQNPDALFKNSPHDVDVTDLKENLEFVYCPTSFEALIALGYSMKIGGKPVDQDAFNKYKELITTNKLWDLKIAVMDKNGSPYGDDDDDDDDDDDNKSTSLKKTNMTTDEIIQKIEEINDLYKKIIPKNTEKTQITFEPGINTQEIYSRYGAIILDVQHEYFHRGLFEFTHEKTEYSFFPKASNANDFFYAIKEVPDLTKIIFMASSETRYNKSYRNEFPSLVAGIFDGKTPTEEFAKFLTNKPPRDLGIAFGTEDFSFYKESGRYTSKTIQTNQPYLLLLHEAISRAEKTKRLSVAPRLSYNHPHPGGVRLSNKYFTVENGTITVEAGKVADITNPEGEFAALRKQVLTNPYQFISASPRHAFRS